MPVLSAIKSFFTARQRIVAGNLDTKLQADQSARQHQYAFNLAMLKNRAFRTEALGGFREQILRDLGCATELRLMGVYNPAMEIVAAYQNCLRGTFGGELKIADEVDEGPVNPALLPQQAAQKQETPETTQKRFETSPIGKIWKWSNLNTAKQLMQEWAANLGTVGLRTVAVNDTDPAKRRVSVQIDDPAVIYDFDEDDRGNVTEIELRYNALRGAFGDREEVEVKEVISKTRFVKEIAGDNVLEPDQQKNELGVCPYVILRHHDEGEGFGRWAYDGSEEIIYWLNLLLTNQGESVMEHAWPEWFAAAGGPAPITVPLGKKKVAYVKMEKDVPPPIFAPMVAQLDQSGALAYAMALIEKLHGRQPEIVLSDVKVLSGQSGETIAKLQTAAETRVLEARAQYEHALIRAMQIGLSEGVRMSLWDLGTGGGSAEAADAAYQGGKEDFAFKERSALPPTTFDVLNQAKANQADAQEKLATAAKAQVVGFDQQSVLEHAGKTPAEAKAIKRRRAQEDVVPTDEQ